MVYRWDIYSQWDYNQFINWGGAPPCMSWKVGSDPENDHVKSEKWDQQQMNLDWYETIRNRHFWGPLGSPLVAFLWPISGSFCYRFINKVTKADPLGIETPLMHSMLWCTSCPMLATTRTHTHTHRERYIYIHTYFFFFAGASQRVCPNSQPSTFSLGNSCKGCMMLKWLSIYIYTLLIIYIYMYTQRSCMSWGSNTSTKMPYMAFPHIYGMWQMKLTSHGLVRKSDTPKIRESQKMSQKYQWIITGWWCNVPILKNDGVRQWEGLSWMISHIWNGK